MLRWSILFFVLAVAAAIFGFTGLAGTFAWLAQVLLVLFLVLLLITLILPRARSGGTAPHSSQHRSATPDVTSTDPTI